MTSQKINANLKFLIQNYKNYKGIILQGSSRSGKTISIIDFIIYYCSQNSGKTINIIKETYNEFKTTLYLDFKMRLSDFDLDNPFLRKKEIASFNIFDNQINFLGADQDKKFHGASANIVWFNEALHISKQVFDQSEMRCRECFISDFNPSLTIHYLFDSVLTRNDVATIKTTFKDNPFISQGELSKILSYEPTPKNIEQGTADEYMWKVYGLGEKAEIKGAIYTKYKEIKDATELQDGYFYGLDFGFTVDPTALTRYKRVGNKIFTELLIYEPIPEPSILIQKLKSLGIENYLPIICDSSDRYVNEWGVKNFVRELQNAGFEAMKVSKTKNKTFWLGETKIFEINVIKNDLSKFALKELEQYKMAEIKGISINKPEDGNDHFCDTFLYCFMSEENNKIQFI